MKKIAVVFITTIIAILNIFPSFASVATPSVASVSNAFPMEEYFETDGSDTPPFFDIPLYAANYSYGDINNTVDYNDTYIVFVYYDMSGTVKNASFYPDSSGHFSITRPSDFVSVAAVRFVLLPGAIPPTGKYDVDFGVAYDVGSNICTDAYLASQKPYSNANYIDQATQVGFTDIGGDIVVQSSVDINSGLLSLYINLNYSSFGLPNSGTFKFEFTRVSSSTTTDVDSAGSSMSDSAQDTADNTAQIADNTQTIADNQAEIMDTIREQVQYITLQLEAFWNQLAAEFTNLFNKMNDQLSSLLSGITEQTEEIVEHLGNVQTEINQSTTEINNNIDQSTDQITNGYDNSGLNQAANNYHEADQNLENAQDEAWNQGADRINDFEFGDFDFSPGVLLALSFLGNFLQQIFVGIGFFNLPITIGLTLLFGLMIIGYYRFH